MTDQTNPENTDLSQLLSDMEPILQGINLRYVPQPSGDIWVYLGAVLHIGVICETKTTEGALRYTLGFMNIFVGEPEEYPDKYKVDRRVKRVATDFILGLWKTSL